MILQQYFKAEDIKQPVKEEDEPVVIIPDNADHDENKDQTPAGENKVEQPED